METKEHDMSFKVVSCETQVATCLEGVKQERRNSESEKHVALGEAPTSTFSKFTKAPVSCYLWPNKTQAMAKRIRA